MSFYHPQVRELEKQLGQTQNRSVGTARDELSVCPDPRKLSAQEKNLLRLRNLEREKQEGWEVTPARGEAGEHEGPRDHEAPERTWRHCLEAGGTWGFASPLCMFRTSCRSSLNHLTESSPRAHFMNFGWPHPG